MFTSRIFRVNKRVIIIFAIISSINKRGEDKTILDKGSRELAKPNLLLVQTFVPNQVFVKSKILIK